MFNDLLVHFTGRLTGGRLNILVATHSWIVPTLQTIHILSVAVVLSGVALINLRIVGIVERGQPIAAVLDRFLWPVTLAVAVLCGYGNTPDRRRTDPCDLPDDILGQDGADPAGARADLVPPARLPRSRRAGRSPLPHRGASSSLSSRCCCGWP
jgi:hypothetical protein